MIMRILLLVLLASCAGEKAINKPSAEFPEQWLNAQVHGKPEKEQKWWSNFNDPQLSELIETAIKDNHSLQIAKERVLQARAQSIASTSKFLPTVNGVASTSRGKPGVIAQNKKQTIYQANFDASYEIDLFGANAYAAKADRASILSAQGDLQNTLISLVAEVANAYTNLRYWQESQKILQQIADSQKKVCEIQANSYKVGKSAKSEELESSARYAANLVDLASAKDMVNSAYLSLLTLLGKNPGEYPSLLAYSGQFPSLSAEQLIDAPIEVIANRPDVKAAEHSAFSTAYLEQSIRRSVFPKISVSAIFGLQNSNFYNQTGIWQANTNLLMPLLNWGAVSAAIKTAKSKHRQALLVYRQSVIEALADVETKIHSKLTSKNNLIVQTEAFGTAQKIFAIAAARHKAGIISDTDYQASLQSLCIQRQQLLLAAKSDTLAAVALTKALGE